MTLTTCRFGGGVEAEGNASMRDLLGGKGANLCEMANMGLPVPPGIIISTEVCEDYLSQSAPDRPEFFETLWTCFLEEFFQDMENYFGYMPMFSVRSGARVSMPGMMDTILNVGLSGYNVAEWDERLGAQALDDCNSRQLKMFQETVGKFPGKDLKHQIWQCVDAVFRSWNSDRAKHYRKMHDYSDDWGTACIIQVMVFGNLNDKSCSGVMFTRDPSTGQNQLMGDFLPRAQGEDVVAGTHATLPLAEMTHWDHRIAAQLLSLGKDLELYYRFPQDIEFTVQNGELYILQTRNAKCSTQAEFRIAWEMYESGLISKDQMFQAVSASKYAQLQELTIAPGNVVTPVAKGKPAGGTLVRGKAMFSSASATGCTGPCILVAKETTPEDIAGMDAAIGILTSTGGETSHAAVVARGLDKTCVVGCTAMKIDSQGAFIGNDSIQEGDEIVINGATGEVYIEELPELKRAEPNEYAERMIAEILKDVSVVGRGVRWADRLDGILIVQLSEFDVMDVEAFQLKLEWMIRSFQAAHPSWADFVVFDIAPTFLAQKEEDEWMTFLTAPKASKFHDHVARNAEVLHAVLEALKVPKAWATCREGKQYLEKSNVPTSILQVVEMDIPAICKSRLAFKHFGG